MKTITRLGTFDDILASAPEDVRKICRALRALIRELHADCTEVPRAGEKAAAYGFGEKKMPEACAYIMPQSIYANLGFFHGATIAKSNPSLEGTGAKLRHIKIRDVKSAKAPETMEALLDAIAERKAALGLKNRS